MTFRRGCLPFALTSLMVLLSFPLRVTAHIEDSACSGATPVAIATQAASRPTTDEAFVMLMTRLTNDSLQLADLAEDGLVNPELMAIVTTETAHADQDREFLSTMPGSEVSGDIYPALNVVLTHMAELDLPATQGGAEGFGATTWLETLCVAKTPFDALFADALLDLSGQKVALAEVGAVFGESDEIRAFAEALIERETQTQAAILALELGE